jgi:endonuclease YncB( thermonuclease family)
MFSLLVAVLGVASPTCHAIDGDTIKCDKERIRLLGIDAPELAGHCRNGRICAPGDPQASKDSLAVGMGAGALRIETVTHDRFGRVVGVVYAGRENLSCWQLRRAMAIYKSNWDNGRRIAKACPSQTGEAM